MVDHFSADAKFKSRETISTHLKVIAKWIYTSSIGRSPYAGNTYPKHEQVWLGLILQRGVLLKSTKILIFEV
jgi:hypothetical protein